MNTDRKQKLIDLEAENLADALLELAAQSGAADDLVERLIATPTENIQRFRKKLNSAGLLSPVPTDKSTSRTTSF